MKPSALRIRNLRKKHNPSAKHAAASLTPHEAIPVSPAPRRLLFDADQRHPPLVGRISHPSPTSPTNGEALQKSLDLQLSPREYYIRAGKAVTPTDSWYRSRMCRCHQVNRGKDPYRQVEKDVLQALNLSLVWCLVTMHLLLPNYFVCWGQMERKTMR